MLKQLAVSLLLMLIVAIIVHGWWLSGDGGSASSQPFVVSMLSVMDELAQAERFSQHLDKELEACQFAATARDQAVLELLAPERKSLREIAQSLELTFGRVYSKHLQKSEHGMAAQNETDRIGRYLLMHLRSWSKSNPPGTEFENQLRALETELADISSARSSAHRLDPTRE